MKENKNQQDRTQYGLLFWCVMNDIHNNIGPAIAVYGLDLKPNLTDEGHGKVQQFSKLYEDTVNRMSNTKSPSPELTTIFHVIQYYIKFAPSSSPAGHQDFVSRTREIDSASTSRLFSVLSFLPACAGHCSICWRRKLSTGHLRHTDIIYKYIYI